MHCGESVRAVGVHSDAAEGLLEATSHQVEGDWLEVGVDKWEAAALPAHRDLIAVSGPLPTVLADDAAVEAWAEEGAWKDCCYRRDRARVSLAVCSLGKVY